MKIIKIKGSEKSFQLFKQVNCNDYRCEQETENIYNFIAHIKGWPDMRFKIKKKKEKDVLKYWEKQEYIELHEKINEQQYFIDTLNVENSQLLNENIKLKAKQKKDKNVNKENE